MARRVVDVVVPVAIDQAYSYQAPDSMALAPGDIVTVPLGTRAATAVVWAENPNPNPRLDNRLKAITDKLDYPGLKPELRTFIDWVSNYTLVPRGMVLRMALRMGEHLGPARERVGVRLTGPTPKRMTPARQRVLALLADGLARMKGEVAEEAAGEDEGFAPDERADEIPGEEAREGHADLAGDGGGNGAESGDELCEEQGDGAAAGEVALGLADAGGGLEGEAAEKLEDAVAVAAAEGEPDGVGDDAGEEHGDGDAEPADAMGCTERACGEKDGYAWDRDADLLHQHPEEDDEVRVVDEENDGDRHGNLLSVIDDLAR